jgi:hypothetical protein
MSDYNLERNAFEASFITDSNLHAWTKIGVAAMISGVGRVTRTCLHNKQVRRELSDNADGMNR